MQRFSIRAAAAALLVPLAASCASHRLPASPVPAPLTDMEAARLADIYLDQQNVAPHHLTSIEPLRRGHLLTYHTEFNPAAKPPKESHLVLVKFDGTVRELEFREGR